MIVGVAEGGEGEVVGEGEREREDSAQIKQNKYSDEIHHHMNPISQPIINKIIADSVIDLQYHHDNTLKP